MEELTQSRSVSSPEPAPASKAERVAPSVDLPQLPSHPRLRTRLHRSYLLLARTTRHTVLSVSSHGSLDIAQSTAYASIVALFPTLIVAAAVIGLLPDYAPIRLQLAAFFDRILPPVASPLLDIYFQNTPTNTHTIRALITAGLVSFAGASNVIVTLMEGLRRARNLSPHCWTFWQRRWRSFLLVFLSLIPLAAASLLVAFGHLVNAWFAADIPVPLQSTAVLLALLTRWLVALAASVGLIALLYHLGVPRRVPAGPAPRPTPGPTSATALTQLPAPPAWTASVPGAVVATLMWFLTTLAFGWYITRFANYSEIYGSLGAGIALLFWLYIVSLSVLCGAKFNAQLDFQLREEKREPHSGAAPAILPGSQI